VGRRRFAALIAVVAAAAVVAVSAILFLPMMRIVETTGGPTKAAGGAIDAVGVAKKAVKTTARRRDGPGALVGCVRVFGDDKPVVGARVTIESQEAALHAATQADGSFAFAGVAAADDWTLTVVTDALGDARLAGIVVVARQTTDVGVVWLAPRFGVPGVVVDERGRPIDGATVIVCEQPPKKAPDLGAWLRDLARPLTPAQEAKSAADGRFLVSGLPPGTYLVLAKKPGYATAIATSVIVAPNATIPIRLAIESGHRVTGRVVRAGAGAVAGIPIVAVCMNGFGASADVGLPTKVLATTETDGAFALDGLGAGRWQIVAVPPDEAMTFGGEALVPRTTFFELRLDGVATLSGRVTDAGGASVAAAEVHCECGPTNASATTDCDGRYEIRGLAAAVVTHFVVHADGFATFGADAMFDRARREDSVFALKAGANTRDVRLVAGGTARGLVVEDGTTTGVAAATVTALSGSSFFDVAPSATTDDAGRFEITGVPIGASVLVVKKAGWCQAGTDLLPLLQALKPWGPAPTAADAASATSGPGIVVARQGDVVERTLAMTRGVLLRGRVIEPSGRPVPGAQIGVKIVAAAAAGFGRSFLERKAAGVGDPARLADAEGRFEVAAPFVAGKVRLVATAPGYRGASSDEIEIGGASPPDTELKLALGGTIEGRVTDASGAPLEGVAASWRRPTDPVIAGLVPAALLDLVEKADDHGRTTTAKDGSYRLALVDTGNITLAVRDGRHVAVERALDVEEGKTLRADATLESGLTITGRVTRLDGRPPTGAWVAAHPAGDGVDPDAPSGESTTDPDGRFRVVALAPGEYRLFGHAQGAPEGEPVVVAAGAENVEIRLAARLSIAGFVKFADGAPAVGAMVEATGVRLTRRSRTSDDGAFRVDDLDDGPCDVSVESGPAATDSDVRRASVSGVAAGATDVAITVEPGESISGEIVGPDGAPVPSGFVYCKPASGAGSTATIRAGRFVAHGLAAGTYVVTVSVRGLVAPPRSADAGAKDVTFRLTRGGSIKGRVLLPDGKPACDAKVSVEEGNGESSWSSFDAAGAGAFTLEVVVAGTHRVTAELEDGGVRYVGEVRDVRVVEGATTEGVEIRLKKVE